MMSTANGTSKSSPVLDQFSLKNKTIVITGGARGLGLSFAIGLAQAGASIACIDIHSKPQDDSFNTLESWGGKAKYYQSDVRDYERLKDTIDTVAKDFGGIYGCIPAAGIIENTAFLEMPVKEFTNTIDINLTGVFSTIQLCAAHMVRQNAGGAIVAISSVAGHKATYPQTASAYVASKFAVRGLVKQIAAELSPYNIRCNSISPGTFMTPMLRGIIDINEGISKKFEGACLAGRIAEPEELRAAMLFLMSGASGYVTGNDLLIDGGATGAIMD